MIIRLEFFPMPPSVNAAYQPSTWRRGRISKTKVYEQYEKRVELYALTHRLFLQGAERAIKAHGFWKVSSVFHFNTAQILAKAGHAKRNDTSNRVKVLHDKVAAVLNVDDCIFWDHAEYKRITDAEPFVRIELTAIDPYTGAPI